ncbi:hypothetical protein U3516DRAFT_753631 [Neocallimastix sp. 'constans']
MGHICPEYNSIKSLSNKKKENFMIFKNHDLIAFQSPFQDETFLYCTYNLVDNKYSSIEIFHCDFEKAISNAAEKVFLIHIINNASEINNKLSRNGKKINQMNSVLHFAKWSIDINKNSK